MAATPRHRRYRKVDFPVAVDRHYLEPGPIVLITSHHKNRTNIMTLGWQTVLEFTPSLVGCLIASSNVSFDMIRRSRECVINVPTTDLYREVIHIGNTDGDEIDKFAKYKLTAELATEVKPPLIAECPVSFECRLHDGAMIDKYNFFIFEIVKAHATNSPRYPKTLHYRGKGVFTLSGETVNWNRLFKKWKGVLNHPAATPRRSRWMARDHRK